MNYLNLSPPFEQTSVYRLASCWLDPDEEQEVCEWLLALIHPDPQQRQRTVFHMRQQYNVSMSVPLLVALHDPDSRVRGAAANAMVYFPDARAVEPLIALLRDAKARSSAALALGFLQDRRAVEPLIAVFQEESARQQREATARGGLLVPDHDTVLGEQSIIMRAAAARALGLLGDARAVEVLCSALTARSGHLRAASARALGQVGDARAIEPLLAVLQDGHMLVRRAAFWSLCRVGDERAVEPLLALLQQGSGPQRRAAAQALGRIGDVRAIGLLALHSDQDPRVRIAVQKALNRLR